MTVYEEAPEGSTAAATASVDHPVAGLPSDNPSASYWLQDPSKVLLGHRTTEELPAEVDVVVVGSGITGSFAADALLEGTSDSSSSSSTPKVLLLEAREACFGATGRNGGHCQPMVYSSAYDVSDFELATFHFLEKFVAEHDVPCDWRTLPGGGVHAYLDMDLFGLAEELVSTLREKRPDLADQITVVKADNTAEGKTLDDLRLRGAAGALVQKNAASVWPYKLVAWVLERLVEKHAASGAFNLQTNTPVLSVKKDSSSPSWVVETPRGKVQAKAVLLATNGYSSHLLPRSLADLVVPVRAQIAALVPPSSNTQVETSQTVESGPAGVTSSSTSSSSSSVNGASKSSITVVETKDGQTTTTTTTTTTSNTPADRLTHSYVFVGHDRAQARGGNRDEYLVQRPFTSGSNSSGRSVPAHASASSSSGNASASAFSSSSSPSASSGGHFIWGGGRQRAAGAGVGEWRDDEVETPVAGYLRSNLAPVLAVGGDNSNGEPAAQLEADYEWTGIMGFSRDANPWVGRVPSAESGGDGLYLAAGFTGHGMPSTSLCGRAVAGMIKRDLGFDADAASSGEDDNKVVVTLPLQAGGHAELPRSFLLTAERIQKARETCEPVAAADTRGFLAEFQHLLAARRAEQ